MQYFFVCWCILVCWNATLQFKLKILKRSLNFKYSNSCINSRYPVPSICCAQYQHAVLLPWAVLNVFRYLRSYSCSLGSCRLFTFPCSLFSHLHYSQSPVPSSVTTTSIIHLQVPCDILIFLYHLLMLSHSHLPFSPFHAFLVLLCFPQSFVIFWFQSLV